MNALERIAELKLLPVIRIADLSDAVPLADALIGGGLPAAEITFRTECAAEAIFRIRNAFPEMLVGAGTVLSVDHAKSAAAAGAGFIVSPGSNPAVIGYCTENGIPIVRQCRSGSVRLSFSRQKPMGESGRFPPFPPLTGASGSFLPAA